MFKFLIKHMSKMSAINRLVDYQNQKSNQRIALETIHHKLEVLRFRIGKY